MSRIRGIAAAVVATLALLVVPGGAAGAVVTNGDFETGNLSGWQHADSPDSTAGSWFAYTGTAAPMFGATIAAPPQGNWGAVTDQGGPGRRILYQDVTVPPATAAQLSSFVYYRNAATSFTTQPNLDYTGPTNQQYRFDLIRPTAPVDSVASGDVLATLFQTSSGDPQSLAPTLKTLDVTALAGQTVRIRLAEVDNDGNLWASADAVSVHALTVGKAKLNKKNGTAKLPVTVTDAGTATLTGKGVKSASASKAIAVQGGTVTLKIKPKGKTKKKLNASGKAKVKVTITYSSSGGGPPLTATKKVKLKKG